MPKYICAECKEEAVADTPDKLYCAAHALKALAFGEQVKMGATPIKIPTNYVSEIKGAGEKVSGKVADLFGSIKSKMVDIDVTTSLVEKKKSAEKIAGKLQLLVMFKAGKLTQLDYEAALQKLEEKE